jgi:4-diphosphocytidyl-2-C-methyl-D-erythritol kinase
VTPREAGGSFADAGISLPEILRMPVARWRELLRNDFEESVFVRHPRIGALKRSLYEAGAMYASMSGSGSAVYGIFDHNPAELKQHLDQPFFHIEKIR